MQRAKTFFWQVLFWPIATSLVASVIWGWFEYNRGYDAGHIAGRNDALSAFSQETVEIVLERNLQIDQALTAREQLLNERLAEKKATADALLQQQEAAFRKRLAEEEVEFRRGLDELVRARYGAILLETQTASYEQGKTAGYADGRAFGQTECQLACDRSLEDFKSSGRLWLRFADSVRGYLEVDPRTETEMRSRAEAIVNIALQGRAATAALASQLNSQVDEIARALEQNDLERIKELIRSLALTLEAKGEVWQRNYRIIVLQDQG